MEDQVGIFDSTGRSSLLLKALKERARLDRSKSLSTATIIPEYISLTLSYFVGNMRLDGDLQVSTTCELDVYRK